MSEQPQILNRPPLLNSIDGEKLLHLALTIAPGALLTYEAVKATLGIDMQEPRGRQLWRRVQSWLAAEQGYQFANVPKIGYQRLDDDGKVDKSGKFIGQAVKRVRSAGRVMATTDRAKLSPPKQLAHDVQHAVIAVMQTAAKPAIIATRAKNPDAGEMARLLDSVRALQ